MRAVAIIPARNEAATIAELIPQIRRHVDSVIVVDDGSTDATSLRASKAGATVTRHLVNLGKGAALKTGCDLALQLGATHIIVMDADGQHKPGDIPHFISALERHEVVMGYRTFSGKMPIIFRLGNQLIELASVVLFGLHVRDTQCGFRAFRATAYPKLRWKSVDYSVESEMIARVSKRRLSYTQIPIETIYGDKYKGTTVVDGIKIVLNMIRWKVLRSI